ncbi:MAG: PEP-CTERM sorting domain-containing protein [Gemmatimonas sp.]
MCSLPASAQTFGGTTSGCFYQAGSCTPSFGAALPVAGPTMSFTGNTFAVTAPGPLLLTGTNNLGTLTVGIDPNAGTGWNFLLNVGFSMPFGVAPAPAGQNLFTAGLTGTFTNKNDVLSLNFDNTAHTFNYTGGSFNLNVTNDPTFTRNNNGNNETASAQINGQITMLNGPIQEQGGVSTSAVVPEPGTYALVTAGLAILGLASRRRRKA